MSKQQTLQTSIQQTEQLIIQQNTLVESTNHNCSSIQQTAVVYTTTNNSCLSSQQHIFSTTQLTHKGGAVLQWNTVLQDTGCGRRVQG